MDEEEELPCLRDIEEDGTWWCINDHTGCLYNDGNNGCNHPGKSICPLEGETACGHDCKILEGLA